MASNNYIRKDQLYLRAKDEGYRSRAAYKLLELDKRHGLLRKGARVLDLGSFPGGWLQVAAGKVGKKGVVLGVDLKELDPVYGGAPVEIFCGDVMSEEFSAFVASQLEGRLVNVVLSDMSPQLSGIRFRDAVRSAELVELAFGVCRNFLSPGGSFVAKIFPGPECEELARELRLSFDKFSRRVLESSRKSSNELYLVGQGFKRDQVSRSEEGDQTWQTQSR